MPCSCCTYGGVFDDKEARRNLRRYRRKGLDAVGRDIVAFLTKRGVAGDSVLEVGGGIGALQLELLRAGAASTTNVELSPAYDAVALELARGAPVERRLGDFVEIGETVGAADDVVLNKVVCCYPDLEALVGAAADHARRVLVLSYPRNGLVARAFIRGINLVFRLRRSEFRVHSWPIPRILAAAEARGLRLVGEQRASYAWRWAAFER